MRLSRLFIAAGLVLVFTTAASAAPPAKAQKKAAKPVQGVIESVEKNKVGGTMTVKIQQKKKAAAAAPAQATEKKFQITEATKIEKAAAAAKGQKKAQKNAAGTSAAFSDLSKGLQVAVTAKADSNVAEKVTILGQAKKKKIK